MNTVKRIKSFIDYKGISVRKFEETVGFSNGSFASQYRKNKTIGVDKVENILHLFPEINPEWLLTGKGEMLKTDHENNEKTAVVPLTDSVQIQKKINSLELKVKRLEALNESYREEINELKNDLSAYEKK